MKKILLLCTFAVLTAVNVNAQSWGGMLSGLSKSLEESVTGGAVTDEVLVGTWEYSKSAIKLKSDNALANLGAEATSSMITEQLDSCFYKFGIKEGCFNITFQSAGIISTVILEKNVAGTYKLAEGGKSIEIGIVGCKNTYPVDLSYTGGNLSLLFGGEKLLNFIKDMTGIVSSESTSTIESLLQQYKELMIGFELKKKKTE